MRWLYWRPVVAKYASLNEVKTLWTIDDLFDAHEILDLKEEAEEAQMQRLKK